MYAMIRYRPLPSESLIELSLRANNTFGGLELDEFISSCEADIWVSTNIHGAPKGNFLALRYEGITRYGRIITHYQALSYTPKEVGEDDETIFSMLMYSEMDLMKKQYPTKGFSPHPLRPGWKDWYAFSE